jgi:hypothetical protein
MGSIRRVTTLESPPLMVLGRPFNLNFTFFLYVLTIERFFFLIFLSIHPFPTPLFAALVPLL